MTDSYLEFSPTLINYVAFTHYQQFIVVFISAIDIASLSKFCLSYIAYMEVYFWEVYNWGTYCIIYLGLISDQMFSIILYLQSIYQYIHDLVASLIKGNYELALLSTIERLTFVQSTNIIMTEMGIRL